MFFNEKQTPFFLFFLIFLNPTPLFSIQKSWKQGVSNHNFIGNNHLLSSSNSLLSSSSEEYLNRDSLSEDLVMLEEEEPKLANLLEAYKTKALKLKVRLKSFDHEREEVALKTYLEILIAQFSSENLYTLIYNNSCSEVYQKSYLLTNPLKENTDIALKSVDPDLKRAVNLFFTTLDNYLDQDALEGTALNLLLKKRCYIDQYKSCAHLFSIALNFHMLLHYERLKKTNRIKYYNFLHMLYVSVLLSYFNNQNSFRLPFYAISYLGMKLFSPQKKFPQLLSNCLNIRNSLKAFLIYSKSIAIRQAITPETISLMDLKKSLAIAKNTFLIKNNFLNSFYKGLELASDLFYYLFFTSFDPRSAENRHLFSAAKQLVVEAKKEVKKIEERSEELNLVVEALKSNCFLASCCRNDWKKDLLLPKQISHLLLSFTYKEGLDYHFDEKKGKNTFFSDQDETEKVKISVRKEQKNKLATYINRSALTLFSVCIAYSIGHFTLNYKRNR